MTITFSSFLINFAKTRLIFSRKVSVESFIMSLSPRFSRLAHLRLGLWQSACFAIIFLLLACSKGGNNHLPDNFKSLSTPDQMEYLMGRIPPDSLARFICNAAMGKIYNARMELQPAMLYAYEKYDEDDAVQFQMALAQYQENLPLNEKVRITKLLGIEDPDQYSYDLGLSYVGDIRIEQKDINQISEELAKLQKECKSDPDFYKRFMKGFKTALQHDRHHDLDDKIYLKFISYPDSIK